MNRELKIYKQVNTGYWKKLEIGKFYEGCNVLLKLLDKPEPEVIVAESLLFMSGTKKYYYRESSNWKDYDCGCYKEISEEEYQEKAESVKGKYKPLEIE